ncbi:hypothetical protein BON22_0020 [Cyberlindnera fabianii]|nr:hypothetical protein BON22_0020 [Cyberlindnera fabianii]
MAGSLSSSHPNNISELWMDTRMDIKKITPHSFGEPKRKQWHFVRSQLNLNWQGGVNTSVEVANGTQLLGDGVLSTMFIVDEENGSSWANLKELDIGIPLNIRRTQRLSHLKKLGESTWSVSETNGNVLKSLEGGSAAQVLMQLLDEAGIKKTVDVFAKVSTGRGSKIHKVIAGGGQWGAGADILVLENMEFSADEDTTIEFLVVDIDTTHPFKVEGLSFENVPLDSQELASDIAEDTIFEDRLCFGSAGPFDVNGLTHSSPFEALSFEVED